MVFGFKFAFWKFKSKETVKIIESKDKQDSA